MSSIHVTSESHTSESMNVLQVELRPVALRSYKSVPVRFVKDINSLFNVTKDVLLHTTSVAEKCLLGNQNIAIHNIESKPPVNNNFAWRLLREIFCKVSCENEDDVIGSILKITASYSWAGRAVLTLAAFAWAYGELLSQIDTQETKGFGPIFSWLKRVNLLTGFQQNDQFKNAIVDLHKLTSSTLVMIESIRELEELSNEVYIEDHSFVTRAETHVKYYSRLAISAAVACMAQVNCLTFDSVSIIDGIPELNSDLGKEQPKLQNFINTFKFKKMECAYWKLDVSFRKRKGIVDVFTCFMYPHEPKLELRLPGNLYQQVNVETVLSGQNVLLFISEVNIPPSDLSALQKIHNELVERNYKIVWVPMVVEWTLELIDEFEKVKQQMPWYILCHEPAKPIVGIEYIKKQWQYCYKPMVVVLDTEGGIQCPDAMQMIRIWGFEAFPFVLRPGQGPGIRPIIIDFIDSKIEDEKYIFLYGGTNKTWLTDFGIALIQMISHDYFKTTKFAIIPFAGEIASRIERAQVIVPKKKIGQFWSCIDSLLYVKMQSNQVKDQVTDEIKKLLSFRDEEGWAALCQGSNILVCASGKIILKAVQEFNKWNKNDKFEVCLRNYLKQILIGKKDCRHVSLQNCNGWLPAEVTCPDCHGRMERVVTYKCCHPTLPEINGAS